MQTVASGWTAEERDSVRKIAQSTQVSWHLQSTVGNRTFTIGVSTIGGNDVIGINPGAVGSPSNYRYFDESQYVTGLSWERGLKMPIGGLSSGLADIQLDNTSNRFTPRYMGGNSELYTAILPRRPIIINAGFNYNGVDQVIPQFSGIVNEQPEVNMRSRTVRLRAGDYTDYFQNKYLDHSAVYTSTTTDVIMKSLLMSELGMSTAQFDLDHGINNIPFGFFEAGAKVSTILDQLAESENGQVYQDETGILRFENRQHWDSSPYTQIQRVILTSQVLNAEAPNFDHLVNAVEVNVIERVKQPLRPIMNFNTATNIPANSTVSLFFDYGDPVLQVITPSDGGTDSYYLANATEDDTGYDMTSSVSVKSIDNFSTSSKIVFQNNSSVPVSLNHVVISGRLAVKTGETTVRLQDDSSVTAYQERLVSISNPYIQDQNWAQSLAQVILNDFAEFEKIQKITIRAIPELQLGDYISWQGRYWRIFDIKNVLDPSSGFIQELTMLQRTVTSYFRIGISTIGGSDKIAP